MNDKYLGKIGLAMLLLASLHPERARAIGLLIPNQDAFAIGRGDAFAATANNPSAIYYNPAGISQLTGTEIEVGDLNYLGLNVDYRSPNGQSSNTKFQVVPVPHIYFTTTPTNHFDGRLSFGVGLYFPFGLGVRWPQDGPLRTLALDSQLYYVTVNPIVSYKITDNLSFGIGPTINYTWLKFNRGLFDSFDKFQFTGSDVEASFNAGLLWHPVEKWSFGANYRYANKMYLSGTSTYSDGFTGTFSSHTTTELPFPEMASVGISYRPTPKWNIEADVDYIGWHTVGTLNFNGSGAAVRQSVIPFPGDLSLPLNWHDSWQYKIGVTRYFDHGWNVSAGYFYSSDTSQSSFFTPGVPDAALHVGSLGIGQDGEHWHWALAGQLIASFARNITPDGGNTDPITHVSAAGHYQLFIPNVTLSVGYKF